MRVACAVRVCRYLAFMVCVVDSGRFDIAMLSTDFLRSVAVV